MNLKETLEQRNLQLSKIVQIATEKLKTLPVGTLSVTSDNRYYESDNTTGQYVYLGKNKTQRIKQLEEAAYYSKVLKEAEKQQVVVQKAIKSLAKTNDPENVFMLLAKNRTHLIQPMKADNDKSTEWFQQKVPSAPTPDSVFTTLAGEKVRSKSELIIADRLFTAQVPYRYEANVVFGDFMRVNPDFTILNKRTGKVYYWEHFGMMDDVTYCQNSQIKLENFAKNGCMQGKNLIVTYEGSKRPLSTEYIDQIIKELLL